jgi:hypothetical protein
VLEDSPISKVTLADALIALGKAVSADEDDQFGLDDSQIDGVLVAMSAICSGVPSVSSKKAVRSGSELGRPRWLRQ